MHHSQSPRSYGGSARRLNAHAADFDPKYRSTWAYASSASVHRAKSFSSMPRRGFAIGVPPEFQFGRRTWSDYYPEANPAFQASLQGNGNAGLTTTGGFDPFVTATAPLSAATAVAPVQANPYSQDTAAALGGAAFFAGQGGFQQPVSHLALIPVHV